MKRPTHFQNLIVLISLLVCYPGIQIIAQFTRPHVYIGISIGGGFSAIVNQNNYGFPEMNYGPEVITQFGGHMGIAIHPWNRIQLDYQIFNARYNFEEHYSSNSTEGEIYLRKQIDLTLINIPLTYRHYLIDTDLASVGNQKTIGIALKRKNTFFVIVGPQITLFRKAKINYHKNNASTDFKWKPADLIDIKPAFDQYVPVDKIPDHLPIDGRDLFQNTILCLRGGIGWNYNLSPELEITLEVAGFISLLDLNTTERDQQNRYKWRHRVYSISDPDPYLPSSLQTISLNASLHYTF